jgi:hypothetical protein
MAPKKIQNQEFPILIEGSELESPLLRSKNNILHLLTTKTWFEISIPDRVQQKKPENSYRSGLFMNPDPQQ